MSDLQEREKIMPSYRVSEIEFDRPKRIDQLVWGDLHVVLLVQRGEVEEMMAVASQAGREVE
jgi:hypothetical protein